VWLNRLLARRLPDDLRVAPQCTFQLSKYSAPEPDFVVVTAASMKKRPLKAVWMIEVAVTSQHKDRGIKARLYAAAGIPEYWVVDAKKLTVDIHRDPGRNGYRSITRHGELEQIAHRGFPSLVFSLRDLANDRVAV
jgi:Uma2 family endonuclease